MPNPQRDLAAEWLKDVLEGDVTKLILSTLIILSVLPFDGIQRFSMVFFGVFAIELGVRVIVIRHELRKRSLDRAELLLLVLDLIATLSFLPLDPLVDIRLLRLVRLTRMVMLLSYWRPVVREIWLILSKRERRYQIAFVISTVVILTFTAAILLAHFSHSQIDFNEDGIPHNESFWTIFWWSFRQLQDPGNLLRDPAPTLAFVFSTLLTLSGVFVIAFLIGLGASVVEELVKLGRERRLGVRQHSLICNVGPHTRTLVEELVAYYAKTFRSPRLVMMGAAPERYDYMYGEQLRRVRYRRGRPLAAHDLAKVDADRAARVILLGERSRENSDAAVISQALSVRESNPDCWIIAEVFNSDNMHAALSAGGSRTIPIPTSRLVSLLIADLVAFPELEGVYNELLYSTGGEIYTCVYGYGQLARRDRPSAQLRPFDELLCRGHERHGVTLLGHLVADDAQPAGFRHVLAPAAAGADPETLRGWFGIAPNFETLKELTLGVSDLAGGEQGEQAPAPRCAVRAAERMVGKILVCGYCSEIAEICSQLARFYPNLQIIAMVPDEARATELTAQLLDPPAEQNGEDAVRFEAEGGRLCGRMHNAPEARCTIQILTGDWSDERRIIAQPEQGYRLAEVDAVLMTPTDSDEDPDARTSLGLLKLLRLMENDPTAIRRDANLLCAVRSGEKAALLERRFERSSSPSAGRRTTIIATERLRHAFLAQAVFVPGIAAIFHDLLSHSRRRIHRLQPDFGAAAGASLTYGRLLAECYRRDQVLVIGYELARDDGTSQVVINPARSQPEYRIAPANLRAVYALGEPSPPRPLSLPRTEPNGLDSGDR